MLLDGIQVSDKHSRALERRLLAAWPGSRAESVLRTAARQTVAVGPLQRGVRCSDWPAAGQFALAPTLGGLLLLRVDVLHWQGRPLDRWGLRLVGLQVVMREVLLPHPREGGKEPLACGLIRVP